MNTTDDIQTKSIPKAIGVILKLMSELSGVKNAPELAPEQVTDFPFFACFPGSGLVWRAHGDKKSVNIAVLECHVARIDLPQDIQSTYVFAESVTDTLLANMTLQGTVETIIATESQPITYTWVPLNWGEVKTLGWQWQISYKQVRTLPADKD